RVPPGAAASGRPPRRRPAAAGRRGRPRRLLRLRSGPAGPAAVRRSGQAADDGPRLGGDRGVGECAGRLGPHRRPRAGGPLSAAQPAGGRAHPGRRVDRLGDAAAWDVAHAHDADPGRARTGRGDPDPGTRPDGADLGPRSAPGRRPGPARHVRLTLAAAPPSDRFADARGNPRVIFRQTSGLYPAGRLASRTGYPTSACGGVAMRVRSLAAAVALALLPVVVPVSTASVGPVGTGVAAAATKPNIFFYNLDDLRDAIPGNIDPMSVMPKTRQWMAAGRRFPQHFVTEPSCCPSRSSLMTGRMPHNDGVRLQSQGPSFDSQHSMACYLRAAGYSTYIAGKFLTTWPRTTTPPCFDHSTVMWGGYNNVATRVDGVARTMAGYSTTGLGVRGREYVTAALGLGKPFLLYETPQAPHWVDVTNPDGTKTQRAVPEPKYASAPVPTCSAPVEANRSDKPAYVRNMNRTPAQGQEMCASQLRAIMTADDQFDA